MDTPLEESNLANIGSDEDRAARKRAAELDVNWEDAGESVGIEIWRVENKRNPKTNAPEFGIQPWPKSRYGEFYTGDSYIVLSTSKHPLSDAWQWDIYFWIGRKSTQDEYGVAAYKANELDDLLGDAPVQHREVEGIESDDFIQLFQQSSSSPYHGIRYLDGGIESGFQHVEPGSGSKTRIAKMPNRLFHVRKTGKHVRSRQVPVKASSLNEGDAFLLDTGSKVLTWYGSSSSPFEKERCAEMAYNIVQSRNGKCVAENDVPDNHVIFWYLLGGTRQDVLPANAMKDDDPTLNWITAKTHEPRLWRIHDDESRKSFPLIPVDDGRAIQQSNLDEDDVFLLDIGHIVFIWIGKHASDYEKTQSMVVTQTHLKNFKRQQNTQVVRVLQGQESRIPEFMKACPP